ncbi:MOSC domain protein [Aspergillus nomiae NRRL 13137]|uniref:MOSC domain protein n=1 Tax=Aspergillus nomiae NRRL (strain ATCC 15546 / NRRL 13137 / CBS 260.88 / M93) TaxID=1509407 RepID=A0A0L1IP35_ASPN3|nr:MOSC domain protein [Aspergillus nomiae NRRL 13137]KNG81311.1 MOSC domain protein [Aspergillus nomiae NRRL 13137]
MLDLDTPKTFTIATVLTLLTIPLLYPQIPNWLKTKVLPNTQKKKHPSSEITCLRVYPIKSCRGLSLEKTTLHMEGLDLDRRWMLIDANTHDFLTIRQIPQMTLINTALSADSQFLVVTFTGVADKEVRVPLRPDTAWLDAHTTLGQVKIWDIDTDAYIYGPEVNGPFSAFLGRDVCLVYKGPTPRVMRGNGDPRLLGRTQSVNFPDVHPVLVASEASIAELNSRLAEKGVDPIGVERFRANVIVKGGEPWVEDEWKVVRIADGAGKVLEFDVLARCARCQVPNVDPDTAEKHKTQPWDTLMSYRRVDEGMKYKPCFGMLCAPRGEGALEVGMRFDVLEVTNEHRYIKGF